MANWTDALPVSDFSADEQRLCLTVAGKPLVLLRVEGRFHAILNECPHAGLPLGEGELRGKVLTCPYHGYAYNVTNGRNVDFPHDELPCRIYPVREHEGMIQVALGGAACSEEGSGS